MSERLAGIFSNKVFSISALTLLACSIGIFLFPENFYQAIETGSLWVRNYFGSFYLWLGFVCVIGTLALGFSPFGSIRLGSAPPEFNRLTWIAMLYSAGMGAGILLRAVQEPVFMFLHPPLETGTSAEIMALEYTFYQWGFTAWAFYCIFALIIAYSLFVTKKDIRLSSLFGKKSSTGRLPKLIDILTIITTITGLVAAVGLGTTQIEGGISHLIEKPPGSLGLNMALVLVICSLAFISAWYGIHKGISLISNWNIYITTALLLFIFLFSDIAGIFESFFNSFYHYLIDFVPMSLAFDKYDPGKPFLTEWTYYYWAFWLAWAPFTGVFIARISKGRTIRELIIGVLLIPSIGSFFWFSVFGDAAFEIVKNTSSYQDDFGNVFTSIFLFLENYPFPLFSSLVVILLLISFLVTSVDSAIYVLSMFTDKGKTEPSKKYRFAWAAVIFIFCEAIILLGAARQDTNVLTAMQKLLIITSLPFAFFTILISILFIRKLKRQV